MFAMHFREERCNSTVFSGLVKRIILLKHPAHYSLPYYLSNANMCLLCA